jgi:hypothetical protein
MAAQDIKLENNDLYVDASTGDFAITQSDTQHVQDIINSWAGWWKEFPTLGVGIKRYLGRSGGVQLTKRAIRIHLKSDGYRADKITVKDSQVYVTGGRIKSVLSTISN